MQVAIKTLDERTSLAPQSENALALLKIYRISRNSIASTNPAPKLNCSEMLNDNANKGIYIFSVTLAECSTIPRYCGVCR
jgi:hypothetical protein